MRSILAATAFCVATAQLPTAQGRVPPEELYRGPLYITRDVTFVGPENGVPLEFSKSFVSGHYALQTAVRSRTLRSVSPSGIVLRLAFGPTRNGLITFRMRADERGPQPPPRITPGGPPAPLRFRMSPESPYPGVLALKPHMKVVFTVERIEDVYGVVVFENADAIELLWEALGRPSFSDR